MQLSEIIRLECVKVPLEATEKEQAITELVDLLNLARLLNGYEGALKAVMQREAVRSTGVGKGFAIPHGKCTAVDKLVMAVGKTTHPIDFESIDHQPVSLIFLLISPPDMTGPHIQALARISRLMTDPESRSCIDNSKTSEELYNYLSEQP